MYAIIKSGGKQYKVAESDTLELHKLAGAKGDSVTFGEVLAVGGDTLTFGSPLVAGASVAAEIIEHRRTATILVFKKRRRQNSKRSRGYREEHTVVRITEILTDGKTASKKAAESRAKKVKPAAVEGEDAALKAAKTKAARKPRVKPAGKADKKSAAATAGKKTRPAKADKE